MSALFVPEEFSVPAGLALAGMRLEPLGPEHNERDVEAWTSSIEHIHATPGMDGGFDGDGWPYPMPPEQNLKDLEDHAVDFAARRGFTYTVLDPETDDVIGCLYIYPAKDAEHDAHIRSWVRASRAEFDEPLWQGVSAWLASDWPFATVLYASRT